MSGFNFGSVGQITEAGFADPYGQEEPVVEYDRFEVEPGSRPGWVELPIRPDKVEGRRSMNVPFSPFIDQDATVSVDDLDGTTNGRLTWESDASGAPDIEDKRSAFDERRDQEANVKSGTSTSNAGMTPEEWLATNAQLLQAQEESRKKRMLWTAIAFVGGIVIGKAVL